MPKLTLPLTARREVAEGTMSFTFSLEGRHYAFRPGQYNMVTLSTLLHQDEKGNTRPFSIASSPRDPFILIATRMRGSAFKRTLAEIPLGTPVDFTGPLGSFTLPRDATRPIVLIAGGIGITPFRSMIKHATEQTLPHKLTLLYANRTPREAPFLEEFQEWERENPNFTFIPTMTKAGTVEPRWTGRTGYIGAAFLRDALENVDRPAFYVAGPPGMVDGVTRALVDAGAAEDRIRTEQFSGYE
ncbi:MAG: FAD-dependent oxidoreductase [Armatimonadota bacterium]|nr:FAD-dependent oxidoreductase [Armatimonadota bacterium]